MIYRVLVGESLKGIKTVLVEEETFEADGGDPDMFFLNPSSYKIRDYGTVSITGDAEHMVPDILEDQ